MPRLLHTMIRVGDLERSKRFYTDVLGMRVLREKEYPGGRFTLCFVGYGDETEECVVELTWNWDTDHYDLGNGFGHLAIGVEDVYAFCEEARAKGANIVREPGPMKHGTTVLAFIEDPDGYRIEILGRG
ncbi:MAG: lactoylglutathione lyase [Candidatus Dadabacteria bacterium]|nr:MAG: lactoylglutathione lyase [Candidatus Dadabacteria bacterium]